MKFKFTDMDNDTFQSRMKRSSERAAAKSTAEDVWRSRKDRRYNSLASVTGAYTNVRLAGRKNDYLTKNERSRSSRAKFVSNNWKQYL